MQFEIETGILKKYNPNEETEIIIPEGVRCIAEGAFAICKRVKSVTIPEGVTKIGDGAFAQCSNLASVTIPASVMRIGDGAFYKCYSLKDITIPSSVMSIGYQAFAECDCLTSVIIHQGVTSIKDEAFMNCRSMKSIMIPASVTSIGHGAFSYNESLTNLVIPENVNIEESVFKGCRGLSDEKGFVIVGRTVCDYFGSDTEPAIPAGITSIGDRAFWRVQSLTSIAVPEGVTRIGKRAFCRCMSLTHITLPESTAVIESEAFFGCESLTGIVIPEGVTSIGNRAFGECSSLTSLAIPENVSIKANAFKGCKGLADERGFVIVGGTVCDYLGSDAELTIPEGVTKIGEQAFHGCRSLTDLVIPEGVMSIGDRAFYDCSNLTSIYLPKNVKREGVGNKMNRYAEPYVFYQCQKAERVTSGIYTIEGLSKYKRFGKISVDIILTLIETMDFHKSLAKNRQEKYIVLAQLFLKYQHPEAKKYIADNTAEVMKYFIRVNDYDTVKGLFECGEFVTDGNITLLLKMAVTNTQNGGDMQIQVYIMNYKNEHFPDSDPLSYIEL